VACAHKIRNRGVMQPIYRYPSLQQTRHECRLHVEWPPHTFKSVVVGAAPHDLRNALAALSDHTHNHSPTSFPVPATKCHIARTPSNITPGPAALSNAVEGPVRPRGGVMPWCKRCGGGGGAAPRRPPQLARGGSVRGTCVERPAAVKDAPAAVETMSRCAEVIWVGATYFWVSGKAFGSAPLRVKKAPRACAPHASAP
jgi:hypothetical protein